MERRWSVPIIGALSALLAVVLVGPGLDPAEGAIPNDGTYSACLTKSTGEVEIINYPKVKCGQGERLIKWSQQGPAGAAGAAGAQGAQGPAGPADWNAIPNKPAGFADGIDDAGVTGIKVTYAEGANFALAVNAGTGSAGVTVDCPPGSRVIGGGFRQTGFGIQVTDSGRLDADTWRVAGWNRHSTLTESLRAVAMCMTVEPDGAFSVAKKGKLKPAKRGQ